MAASSTIVLFLLMSLMTSIYGKEHIATSTPSPLCVASTGQWAPFNLIATDRLEGIGVDMWKEVADRLGLAYRIEVKKSWKEVLDALKEKRCDLTIATRLTQSRRDYALASKPYADYPIVIVTRQDVGFIDDIEQISDKTIALPRFYATSEMVLRHHPHLHVVYTQNIDEALDKVEHKEAFATVGVLPVVVYKISHGFEHLKISGKTQLRFPVSFLVRNELSPLLKQINHAIDAIPSRRLKEINGKWMSYSPPSTNLQRHLYTVVFVTLFLALIGSWYVLRLRKTVERKNIIEKKWRMIAQKDSLTGVYSRYYVLERLLQMISSAQKNGNTFSLVFFDIDYLKEINDRFGHEMGDIAIKRIVKEVQKRIRPEDILGRWGGDEFIIVLPGVEESDVHLFTARMEQAIQRILLAKEFRLSASFGWAVYQKGDTKHSLFQRADARLYEMKKRHHKKRPPMRRQTVV